MPELTLIHPSAPDAHRGLSAVLPTVTFVLGAQEYGLPVADVVEIVPIPAMLALAGAPPYLVGLLNRRGRYLAVLDGRILVGEPAPYDCDRYIIIAGHALPGTRQIGALVGLLVDQVCDVHAFDAESLAPLGAGTAAAFLRGIARRATRSVLLFGFEELLALTPAIGIETAPV
jgi:purine-binding chemotaxis protein CheW